MKIIEKRTEDFSPYNHITFLRLDPEDLSLTINQIIHVFSDLSWISQFDQDYIKSSFEQRAKETAAYLSNELNNNDTSNVTISTGEYVVSELARESLVSELKYADVPLAELFKEKVAKNSGFDYYSENNKIIIFGEAKYLSDKNAYGSGMKQVARFIRDRQDISDLADIDKFFSDEALSAANNGSKSYSIAFSTKKTSSDRIIEGIKRNKQYMDLIKHKELIFIAVNI